MTLEKREQQAVIGTVCSLLELQGAKFLAALLPSQVTSHAEPEQITLIRETAFLDAPPVPQAERINRVEVGLDIRTLKNEKKPTNSLQMACIVAYYLQDIAPTAERTKEVNAADLERLFKQAGYKLPSRIMQVLNDAKGAGYFESVARGKYKLTRVGYNLVTHSLPKAAKD